MKSMKIRKGDTVHILAGKDRGKQGRVLEARPDEQRVLVENLNMVKRHSKPKPIKNPSRMGGQQVTPGGVIDKAAQEVAAKRAAEQAKKQAEIDKKQQKAVAEAEAKFKAAHAAYEAETARAKKQQ